jgi:uncharacterized protein
MRIKNFTANDARSLLIFLAQPEQAFAGPADIGRRLYFPDSIAEGGARSLRAATLLGTNAMLRLEAHGLVEDAPVTPGAGRKKLRQWKLTSRGQKKLADLFPPLPDVVEAPFDCQTCGACCSYFAVISLEAVSDEPGLGIELQDYDDFSKLPSAMLAFERMPEGSRLPPYVALRTRKVGEWHQCLGLEGRVGEACRCDVYDQRPLTCSEFEVGGLKCLKAREARGLSIDGFVPPASD